jgi:hypothetical protein
MPDVVSRQPLCGDLDRIARHEAVIGTTGPLLVLAAPRSQTLFLREGWKALGGPGQHPCNNLDDVLADGGPRIVSAASGSPVRYESGPARHCSSLLSIAFASRGGILTG